MAYKMGTNPVSALEDYARGDLYDLTDGADWPSLPNSVEETLEEMDGSRAVVVEDELDGWRRDIVKAAMAEVVTRLANDRLGESAVKILRAIVEGETETVVAVLEGDEDLNLKDHDDNMLELYASDTGPDHEDYVVTERVENPYDTAVVALCDQLAAKTGGHRPEAMRVPDAAPGCPMVTITLPMSDARELAK